MSALDAPKITCGACDTQGIAFGETYCPHCGVRLEYEAKMGSEFRFIGSVAILRYAFWPFVVLGAIMLLVTIINVTSAAPRSQTVSGVVAAAGLFFFAVVVKYVYAVVAKRMLDANAVNYRKA